MAVAAFTAISVSCSNDAANDFVLVTDVVPNQEIGSYKPITEEQYLNRMILRNAMLRHGFPVSTPSVSR